MSVNKFHFALFARECRFTPTSSIYSVVWVVTLIFFDRQIEKVYSQFFFYNFVYNGEILMNNEETFYNALENRWHFHFDLLFKLEKKDKN